VQALASSSGSSCSSKRSAKVARSTMRKYTFTGPSCGAARVEGPLQEGAAAQQQAQAGYGERVGAVVQHL
jgi:hypothetical protein